MSGLILASASPRRRELLQGIAEFTVEPSLFEERAHGMSARQTAEYFAAGKAKEVFSRFPDCRVLGADTVVALVRFWGSRKINGKRFPCSHG